MTDEEFQLQIKLFSRRLRGETTTEYPYSVTIPTERWFGLFRDAAVRKAMTAWFVEESITYADVQDRWDGQYMYVCFKNRDDAFRWKMRWY